MSKQGNLSIHSENIFPIIKKWLYSDHDIFIRELVSNASDAILKFKKLCDMGEATDTLGTDFAITVTVNEADKTITISGFVTDKEFRLGDATVCFFNSSNKVKGIKSDINGESSIELPENKYRITVKKDGYTSLVGDNFFVDYIFNHPQS